MNKESLDSCNQKAENEVGVLSDPVIFWDSLF